MTERHHKVTIKIPRPLYNRIKQLIEGTGYDSPTDFIVHVLRDIVSSHGEPESELTADDLARIKSRLQRLGYL
ncbi:MAG: CopG family transcriptional regulator [Armatimonadetes bacterium]|nr:CopG family transcriptional regulator [Armatimonadota bacterium]